MVRAWAELGNRAKRSRLELAVFQDGEVDATHHQPSEIDADVLIHRLRIDGIRQMPALLPLHHVHIGCGIVEAAV